MATAAVAPQAIVPKDIVSEPGTKTVEAAKQGFSYEHLPPERYPGHLLHVSPMIIRLPRKPANARLKTVLFGGLRDPHLRLHKPIPLKIEENEGFVSAIFEEIQEFGTGKTMSEAISDFSSTIAELYIRLSQESLQLSDDLLRVKNILSDYIESRSL